LEQNFKRTKLACYTAYFTMSTIFSLPPLLFVTFRQMYGISYTLLGSLVLINFFTQLGVDLFFTLFSKHFNVHKIVKVMPLITSAGLLVYAIVPTFFPAHAYAGLVLGTVIFSLAAGLSEVLLSPVIAAIPSDTPQRDMSLLHSLYAFGVFTVAMVTAVCLKLFGTQNWMYLTVFFALWPIAAAVLFMISPMPDIGASVAEGRSVQGTKKRTIGLLICLACIFFGGAAENNMSTWISGYMEKALGIDKTLGDIFGMATFAILLGITRITYARYGKNIFAMLLCGMLGAVVCYLVVSFSSNTALSFMACILTGVCTSMLWPGTLIMMEENVPGAGVGAFALMAAGGDFGASVAPQLMGIVVDHVSASDLALKIGATANLTVEQVGMKAGMLVSTIFPVAGAIAVMMAIRHFKPERK